MKGRLAYRIVMALLGLFTLVLSIHLTIRGFNGTLTSFQAGLGWLFAVLLLVPQVFRDVILALATIIESKGAQ
jgi:hypothetical protein